MKMRSVAFFLFLGLLAIQTTAETTYAQGNPFACKARDGSSFARGGGSFVLDDSDFQAIAASGVTREKFAALAPNSKMRLAICDARGVWRGFKAGININCLMTTYYPEWIITYWSKPEQDILLKAQIDAVDNFLKCP